MNLTNEQKIISKFVNDISYIHDCSEYQFDTQMFYNELEWKTNQLIEDIKNNIINKQLSGTHH